MNKFRTVKVSFEVYVPAEFNAEDTIEYLNEKLYSDPEFFGEFDYGCIELTNEIE
jgi:hypothetical protein